jgi:two-component system osmolarity sensor histidine kinase EnvZ
MAAELIPVAGACNKDNLQSQINLLRARGLAGISLESAVASDNRSTSGLIYPLPFDALLAQQIRIRSNTPVEALSSLTDVRVRFVCGQDPVWIGFDREQTLGAVPNQALFLWLSALLASALAMAVVLSNSLAVPMRRLAEYLRTTPLGSPIASPAKPGTGIAELDALSAEIHSLRFRANRAVANRSALLMGLSHDLRKPLARIRLILDTVASPNMDDAHEMRSDVLELQDALDEFMRAANAMASPALADGALQSWFRLRRLYPDKRITFKGSPNEATPPLNTAALIRVASNLIDNALRHTEGPVQVRWFDGEKWMLCVDDCGPGIDDAYIAAACSPFCTDSQDGYEHAGLGLALATMICEHNGWALAFGSLNKQGWRVCVKPN